MTVPGAATPPAHTPLAALPVVVLDLETTGLDVRRDRAVQVGALALTGSVPEEGRRLEQILDPGIPISADSSAIHGLEDGHVAGAPSFAGFVPTLAEFLAGRVVVGQHVAFDLAVLRHEASRAGIAWQDPPSLDVSVLLGALEPTLPDLGLETVASRLGVTVHGRHSAMGDCQVAARVWAELLPRLRDAGVRTLGEARAFAARRDDLRLREAHAGWHAMPGETRPGAVPPPGAGLQVDGYAFQRRLDELMSAPPVFVSADAPLREAARQMVERRIGALLVGRPDAAPEGILTERDLLRATAAGTPDLDATPVRALMSTPVACMERDEMLYRALARMDRVGVRHLCVVDEAGAAAGMVSQRDLLRYRTRKAAVLGDAVATAADAAALARAYGNVTDLAAALVDEGLTGREVAGVVSSELRALTGRAAELAALAQEAAGRGAAPAPWCVLVLGSGGRGESLLGADQDNALIHAGTPTEDPWFAAMGAAMADMLDVAGVPRCKGGIMAASPQWRGTLQQWRERVEDWLRRGRPEDLLNVDIFFDLTAVTGDTDLARTLHGEAVALAARTPPFIGLLAQSVQGVTPRLGLFGRLPAEAGRVNLKRDGLLPLVSLARTLALRGGSTARATPDRLRDAARDGRLPESDAEGLVTLHGDLLECVLRQQLADVAEGIPPSSTVVMRTVPRAQRRRLVDGLKRLDGVIGELRAAVSG